PELLTNDGSVGISVSGGCVSTCVLAPPSTPEVATSGTVHHSESLQVAAPIPAEVPDATVENNVSASSPSSSSMVREVGDAVFSDSS
ncbi:hypothetical protein BGZ46_005149, partial [Entomortierella lignicola]